MWPSTGRSRCHGIRFGRRILFCACFALSLIGLGVPDSQASEKNRELAVMTRNMDNGTDFGPIFTAQTPEELVAAVTATYAEIQASNIPERAAAVAKEIAAVQPDLVGLQEVSLWRTQIPGDHALAPDATSVAYDFLDLVERELAARGLAYQAVAVGTNADIELPGASGMSSYKRAAAKTVR